MSTTTGPRSEPTWTVPEGVFESLTTCAAEADAAISSAQNTGRYPMRTSVYSIGPAGACTVNLSPFFRPMSAEPTGDSLLMRPSRGAASAEPTIVKVSSPSPPLMTTFEPMPTLSPFVFSMTSALRSWSSSVAIRPSRNDCSCLASSYSAFSDRSPSSLASWMRAATRGRSTVMSSLSSALSFARPCGGEVDRLGVHHLNPSSSCGTSGEARPCRGERPGVRAR